MGKSSREIFVDLVEIYKKFDNKMLKEKEERTSELGKLLLTHERLGAVSLMMEFLKYFREITGIKFDIKGDRDENKDNKVE
jgi:hypothetical protein